MRTEVDEVREPYEIGKGGSSTMPQKEPVSCPIIMSIGNRLRDCVGTQLTSMMQEHERSVSAMPTDDVIPEVFVISGSFQHAIPMLEGLITTKCLII